MLVTSGPGPQHHHELIITLAARHRLPTVYPDRFYEDGLQQNEVFVDLARGFLEFGGDMLHWIEAQSTSVICLLTLCVCYGMAAIAFICGSLIARRPLGDELKTVSPVTLTPLAVILALLIAFIAARVWENVAHANEQVGIETSALSEIALLSHAFGPEARSGLQDALKQHIDFIVEKEWPAMADFQAIGSESPALRGAALLLVALRLTEQGQEVSRQYAIKAIEKAYVAREARIRLSRTQIAPIQWTTIIVLAMLILLTTALVHIGKPAAMALTLLFFSTATAVSLTLLLAYDRPFAAGGVTISPGAYREINLD